MNANDEQGATLKAAQGGVTEAMVAVPRTIALGEHACRLLAEHIEPSEGETCPITLYIGSITEDDGSEIYGLHFFDPECPEEGMATLARFAALSAQQGQGEDIVDRVAKAIADAAGHGMREKCEHLAHAAIAAYKLATWCTAPPAEPAAQGGQEGPGEEDGPWAEGWAERCGRPASTATAFIEEYECGGRLCRGLVWADHPANTPGHKFTPLFTAPPAQPAERVPEGVFDIARARSLMAYVTGYCKSAELRSLSSDAVQALKELDAMLAASPAPSEGGKGVSHE